MGVYIDKHFGAIGGFSTRRSIHEFVTVLPYSELDEAEDMLEDFVKDFQEHGISEIWAAASERAVPGTCVDFTIVAGLAKGQPIAEIETIIASAESRQKEIGRLRCAAEE
jgi:phospholipid/cholesterol/gamma-HCH transport system ATP-binding protein